MLLMMWFSKVVLPDPKNPVITVRSEIDIKEGKISRKEGRKDTKEGYQERISRKEGRKEGGKKDITEWRKGGYQGRGRNVG